MRKISNKLSKVTLKQNPLKQNPLKITTSHAASHSLSELCRNSVGLTVVVDEGVASTLQHPLLLCLPSKIANILTPKVWWAVPPNRTQVKFEACPTVVGGDHAQPNLASMILFNNPFVAFSKEGTLVRRLRRRSQTTFHVQGHGHPAFRGLGSFTKAGIERTWGQGL